jgi:hypothetical protein
MMLSIRPPHLLEVRVRLPIMFPCVFAALSLGAASAEPIVWNFEGYVVACPSTPPLESLVQCNGPLHGYLRFDDATTPSNPGNWPLPGAVFHAQIGSLVLDGTGASAWLGPNRDALLFEGGVDWSNVPGLGAKWRIESDTYIDNSFDPNQLPAWPPVGDPQNQIWVDNSLVVWLVVPSGDDFVGDVISTDTMFGMTRYIPEPASLAILGTALVWFASRRKRSDRQYESTDPKGGGRS